MVVPNMNALDAELRTALGLLFAATALAASTFLPPSLALGYGIAFLALAIGMLAQAYAHFDPFYDVLGISTFRPDG